MKELKQGDIERDYFISRMTVGDCPNCGSNNTHDCEAPHFESGKMIVPYEGYEGGKIIKLGSECEVARKLDDIGVGHCCDCGYLWCLSCGAELTIENPNCGHWNICDDCNELEEMKDNRGNIIEGAYTCLYDGEIHNCPKIKAWKRERP